MNGPTLFAKSLPLVESLSIREWAQTDRNKPILIQLASQEAKKGGLWSTPSGFAAYMVSLAIGL
jgi:hypothetical protein